MPFFKSWLLVASASVVVGCAGTHGIADDRAATLGLERNAAAAQDGSAGAATTALGGTAAAVTAQAAEPANATTAVETGAAAEPKAEAEDELFCERVQETGTHRRVRRCYTRAQRDESRQEAQGFMRETMRERGFPGEAN